MHDPELPSLTAEGRRPRGGPIATVPQCLADRMDA